MEEKKNPDYKQMYEAVYKTAKQWIEDGCTDKEKICLECVFPQLREDENEKARKTLLLALTTSERVGELKFVLPPSTREECIDWLNRQENTEGSFGRGYDSGYLSCLHSHGAEWLEKQKETLHIQETCKENADSFTGEEDERTREELIVFLKAHQGYTLDNTLRVPKWIAYLERQKEQKPFISEDALREGISRFGITQYQIDNWLKKHLNVTEQKPAEWSEEDKFILEDAITAVDMHLTDEFKRDCPTLFSSFMTAKDWLKSFRSRPHWKPSKEQMRDLYTAENVLRKYKHIAIADKIAELHYCLEQLKQS